MDLSINILLFTILVAIAIISVLLIIEYLKIRFSNTTIKDKEKVLDYV